MRQKRHDRVIELLPLLVADELSWWGRRRVQRHLRGCEDCAGAADRQRQVATELAAHGEASVSDAGKPPADLLDRLLDQAAEPGLRARAAVPARGAVSGARPGLSVALALTLLVLAAAALYAGWRFADHLTTPED